MKKIFLQIVALILLSLNLGVSAYTTKDLVTVGSTATMIWTQAYIVPVGKDLIITGVSFNDKNLQVSIRDFVLPVVNPPIIPIIGLPLPPVIIPVVPPVIVPILGSYTGKQKDRQNYDPVVITSSLEVMGIGGPLPVQFTGFLVNENANIDNILFPSNNIDRTPFFRQNELFNFYQIELTILLFLTLIVILRKYSFNSKKVSFK